VGAKAVILLITWPLTRFLIEFVFGFNVYFSSTVPLLGKHLQKDWSSGPKRLSGLSCIDCNATFGPIGDYRGS
jgi:hypothetical protein